MAGTVRGKIDCFVNTNSHYDNAQNIFKLMYDFLKTQLEPAGVVTEIARWGGNGSNSTSTDFHDGANPFRSAAFCVFRFNNNAQGNTGTSRTWPWYFLMQWSRGDQTSLGISNSLPATLDASGNPGGSGALLAMASAIGVGGDQNPWKGTGTIGSSVKASPVWGTPTGGTEVLVFPRSNNAGGSHTTNKENMMGWAAFSDPRQWRIHFLADADSFLFLWDLGDSGFPGFAYHGIFTPRAGLTHPYPFCQYGGTFIPGGTAQVYGPTNGGFPGGGVAMPFAVSSTSVRSLVISRFDEFNSAVQPGMEPNLILQGYDEFPIPIGSNENAIHAGYLGQVSFMKEIAGGPINAVNSTKSRAIVGHATNNSTTTQAYAKFSVPWDGVHVPRSNFTRNGYTF